MFLAILIISTVGVILAVAIGMGQTKAQTVKTKILTTTVQSTGGFSNRVYTQTTFMVYKTDGTRKAETVTNGTPIYDFYMGKLEG